MSQANNKRNSGVSYFLWWKVDPSEVKMQAEQYQTLSIWNSARKVSSLLLLTSMIATSAFVFFGALPATASIDAFLSSVLAIFTFMGHRWALVGAMILWTLEKLGAMVGSPPAAFVSVIWWCLYMRSFYLAYLVEKLRESAPVPPASGGDLNEAQIEMRKAS